MAGAEAGLSSGPKCRLSKSAEAPIPWLNILSLRPPVQNRVVTFKGLKKLNGLTMDKLPGSGLSRGRPLVQEVLVYQIKRLKLPQQCTCVLDELEVAYPPTSGAIPEDTS